MNPLELVELGDVQAQPDERGTAIDQVGVGDLRYPVTVVNRDGERQVTVAEVEMDVDLDAAIKGTHMSRFIEVLDEHASELSPQTVGAIAVELQRRLDSTRASARFSFPYFQSRTAPVTGGRALADYQAALRAEIRGSALTLHTSIKAPVTSLCPCSKEISDYGAHSQRGYVTVEVSCTPTNPVWLEDLIAVAETSASAPVYPLLKRPDERFVTMQAYDNPAFVEDIARDAALTLRQDDRVLAFALEARNQESIHNHSAVARIHWRRER